MIPEFRTNLLEWNRQSNSRKMPWKGERDPYRIWLSEIILQQTRVEQGLSYYQNFISAYPTIVDLAKAPDQEVFKVWEGLGYYSRCKNLLHTARLITEKYDGQFPSTYPEILSLKGVGPYTAAAIASFAFDLPHAVLDGNVFRVLSRYFGISTAIDSTDGKKLYAQIANELLDTTHPAEYNQAIMDFGATICKPQSPLCEVCIQNPDCQAFVNGWVAELPVKEKKLKIKERWLYYFVVNIGDSVLIRRRSGNDIWQNLYEFVLFDSPAAVELDARKAAEIFSAITGSVDFEIDAIGAQYTHKLTHQTIRGQIVYVRARQAGPLLDGFVPIRKEEIKSYPFPKILANIGQ